MPPVLSWAGGFFSLLLMFRKLDRVTNRLEIDMHAITKAVITHNQVRKFIKDANRLQLWKHGVDREGRVIRTYRSVRPNVYARSTIRIKKHTRQPYNRVTLRQTGAFYRSFRLKVYSTAWTITARFQKRRGSISDHMDTSKVLGLTGENSSRLAKHMRPLVLGKLRRKVLR
jgi:hypothetical protein